MPIDASFFSATLQQFGIKIRSCLCWTENNARIIRGISFTKEQNLSISWRATVNPFQHLVHFTTMWRLWCETYIFQNSQIFLAESAMWSVPILGKKCWCSVKFDSNNWVPIDALTQARIEVFHDIECPFHKSWTTHVAHKNCNEKHNSLFSTGFLSYKARASATSLRDADSPGIREVSNQSEHPKAHRSLRLEIQWLDTMHGFLWKRPVKITFLSRNELPLQDFRLTDPVWEKSFKVRTFVVFFFPRNRNSTWDLRLCEQELGQESSQGKMWWNSASKVTRLRLRAACLYNHTSTHHNDHNQVHHYNDHISSTNTQKVQWTNSFVETNYSQFWATKQNSFDKCTFLSFQIHNWRVGAPLLRRSHRQVSLHVAKQNAREYVMQNTNTFLWLALSLITLGGGELNHKEW